MSTALQDSGREFAQLFVAHVLDATGLTLAQAELVLGIGDSNDVARRGETLRKYRNGTRLFAASRAAQLVLLLLQGSYSPLARQEVPSLSSLEGVLADPYFADLLIAHYSLGRIPAGLQVRLLQALRGPKLGSNLGVELTIKEFELWFELWDPMIKDSLDDIDAPPHVDRYCAEVRRLEKAVDRAIKASRYLSFAWENWDLGEYAALDAAQDRIVSTSPKLQTWFIVEQQVRMALGFESDVRALPTEPKSK
jgi:hypothetical protein